MRTLVDCLDPDAMSHKGMYRLLRRTRFSEREMQYVLETIICDPLIYTIDHPDFNVYSLMENSIGLKRVNASA